MRMFMTMGLGTAMAILAQVDPVAMPKDWGDLTALGIVAVVLVFLVTKYLPDQTRQFAATIKDIQSDFASILDKMHERQDGWERLRHDDAAAQAQALRELAAQCARRSDGNCSGK